jgi:predicted glycosyltransferase
VDVLTPKQALFSKSLLDQAPSKFNITVTTRDYSELNNFVSMLGMKNVPFGRHGGGSLVDKLTASIERQQELIPFMTKNEFDASLSYISPEAARVSFGIGLKHFVCSDSPHANAPCRLAVPLSQAVFNPFPIPKPRWTQYGVKERQVLKYRALDPWAWLKHSRIRASSKVHSRVMIRLEEWFASYFKQGKGVSSALSKLVDGIKKLGDFEITLLARYNEQRDWAIKEFGSRCIIPETTINGAQEISRTDLLIGGGATMTQEAALLGVPNISYFPSAELDVFTYYYFPKKLSVEASNPSQLLRQTFRLLKDVDSQKSLFVERAARETASFEDPIRFIFERLEQAV